MDTLQFPESEISSIDELTIEHTALDYRFRPTTEAFAIGILIMVAFGMVSFFIYFYAVAAQKGEIQDGLQRTVSVAASFLDGDLHRQLVSPEMENGPLYNTALKPLARCLQTDPTITYIYTMVKKDEAIYFILDPTLEGDSDGDGVDDKSHLWELYEDADPYLLEAFETKLPTTTPEPFSDKWGNFVSGYSPFYDSDGNFAGILGMDISADAYFARLAPVKRAMVRAGATSFFLSVIMGAAVLFLRNFSRSLNSKRIDILSDLIRLRKIISQRAPDRDLPEISVSIVTREKDADEAVAIK